MFLEVHVLQNFALSNLNRDDTGSPKTCEFGGSRRARISSQCLKRAVRTHLRLEELVPADQLSHRTKRLRAALAERLMTLGATTAVAGVLADATMAHLDFKLDKGKTEYLLFLGAREMDALAEVAWGHERALTGSDRAGKRDKEVAEAFRSVLDGGGAVDLALFGRMIADQPDKAVDAAVQMAHAFSTHAVATEFDFYSAVDDLQPDDAEEGAGAGMLGTLVYNSSCYYRYANVDLGQLKKNLGGYGGRTASAVRSFLQGMIYAVPTGKQTASAAQNPPTLVMVVVRDGGLWSLANAFVKPVRAHAHEDLMQVSAHAMLDHFDRLVGLYGGADIRHAALATYLDLDAIPAGLQRMASMDGLMDGAIDALGSELQEAR